MKRSARLQAARHWLATLGATNETLTRRDVRAYAKWFGVDLGCALKELRLLGAEIDAPYADQLMRSLRNQSREAATPPPATHVEDSRDEWDDHFAYIAGSTSGGAPFGVTWEEAEQVDDEPGRYDSP